MGAIRFFLMVTALVLCFSSVANDVELVEQDPAKTPVDVWESGTFEHSSSPDTPLGRLEAEVEGRGVPHGLVWPGERDVAFEYDEKGFVKWQVTERQTKYVWGIANEVTTTRWFHLTDLDARSVRVLRDELSVYVGTKDHERSVHFLRDEQRERVETPSGRMGPPTTDEITEMRTTFAVFEFNDPDQAYRVAKLLKRSITRAKDIR